MPEAWFRAARVTSRKASVKDLAGFERHERQTWAGVGSLKAFEPLLRSPDEVCGCQGQSGNLETILIEARKTLSRPGYGSDLSNRSLRGAKCGEHHALVTRLAGLQVGS